MGSAATLGQFLMTHAYRFAPAGIVSTMNLLNAAFSAVLGWTLFGETLDRLQWAGLVVLGIGIASVTLSAGKSRPV
jgi:drug/metabolite transporter (DMT)-like permease